MVNGVCLSVCLSVCLFPSSDVTVSTACVSAKPAMQVQTAHTFVRNCRMVMAVCSLAPVSTKPRVIHSLESVCVLMDIWVTSKSISRCLSFAFYLQIKYSVRSFDPLALTVFCHSWPANLLRQFLHE